MPSENVCRAIVLFKAILEKSATVVAVTTTTYSWSWYGGPAITLLMTAMFYFFFFNLYTQNAWLTCTVSSMIFLGVVGVSVAVQSGATLALLSFLGGDPSGHVGVYRLDNTHSTSFYTASTSLVAIPISVTASGMQHVPAAAIAILVIVSFLSAIYLASFSPESVHQSHKAPPGHAETRDSTICHPWLVAASNMAYFVFVINLVYVLQEVPSNYLVHVATSMIICVAVAHALVSVTLDNPKTADYVKFSTLASLGVFGISACMDLENAPPYSALVLNVIAFYIVVPTLHLAASLASHTSEPVPQWTHVPAEMWGGWLAAAAASVAFHEGGANPISITILLAALVGPAVAGKWMMTSVMTTTSTEPGERVYATPIRDNVDTMDDSEDARVFSVVAQGANATGDDSGNSDSDLDMTMEQPTTDVETA